MPKPPLPYAERLMLGHCKLQGWERWSNETLSVPALWVRDLPDPRNLITAILYPSRSTPRSPKLRPHVFHGDNRGSRGKTADRQGTE